MTDQQLAVRWISPDWIFVAFSYMARLYCYACDGRDVRPPGVSGTHILRALEKDKTAVQDIFMAGETWRERATLDTPLPVLVPRKYLTGRVGQGETF